MYHNRNSLALRSLVFAFHFSLSFKATKTRKIISLETNITFTTIQFIGDVISSLSSKCIEDKQGCSEMYVTRDDISCLYNVAPKSRLGISSSFIRGSLSLSRAVWYYFGTKPFKIEPNEHVTISTNSTMTFYDVLLLATISFAFGVWKGMEVNEWVGASKRDRKSHSFTLCWSTASNTHSTQQQHHHKKRWKWHAHIRSIPVYLYLLYILTILHTAFSHLIDTHQISFVFISNILLHPRFPKQCVSHSLIHSTLCLYPSIFQSVYIFMW